MRSKPEENVRCNCPHAGTAGETTTGKIATVAQRTAYEGYKALNFAAKGLMGEHIVDHHIVEDKGWGLQWNRYDMVGGAKGKADGWQSAPKKLNDQEKPLFLCVPANVVLNGGIDSAWLTNRAQPKQFAIVEAKANMNPAASLNTILGEAQDKAVVRPKKGGGLKGAKAGGLKNPSSGSTTPAAKGLKEGYVMQMSHTWVDDRIKKDFPIWYVRMKQGGKNYSRHVFLVTPVEAAEHTIAIGKIMSEGLTSNPAGAQKYAKDHAKHNVHKEFGEADLDAAEKHYSANGKPSKGKKK